MLPGSSFPRTVAIVLALCRLALPALAQPAPLDSARPAEGPPVEIGFDLDVNSVYVFRGMVYSDGPVTQLQAWASMREIYVYAWSNVAFPAAPGARPLDEIDLGASYAVALGALKVEPAFDLYLYRLTGEELAEGSASRTAEASATVTYAGSGTEVFLTQVVDVGSYAGAYFGAVGLRHDRAITDKTGLGVAASLGWASARYHRSYLGASTAGLSLISSRLSATRRIGRGLYLQAHVDLTTVPRPGLRAQVARPTVFASGVTIGITR